MVGPLHGSFIVHVMNNTASRLNNSLRMESIMEQIDKIDIDTFNLHLVGFTHKRKYIYIHCILCFFEVMTG